MPAATAPVEEAAPKKKSKMPILIGLVLALLGGGGGFMAVQMGLIGGGHSETAPVEEHGESIAPLPAIAFVALEPLVISLAPGGNSTHLKFSAQLEVLPEHLQEVEAIKPRIVDVLNGYLRAVETGDLEDPTALMKLRAQMLRRIQVVAGQGRVRDLLIMEFVLN